VFVNSSGSIVQILFYLCEEMAKLSEPVMAQISVVSNAKTLTKQARVIDTESGTPFPDRSLQYLQSQAVKSSSPVKSATGVGSDKMGNGIVAVGHLEQLLLNDTIVGASSEEISTASTEIVSVRPTHRNQNQNKRDLRIRSVSADRILEEDIKFSRVDIDIEKHCHELTNKNSGGAAGLSKKITRQQSDGSYLSWQDSETSCQDSLSTRQDSFSIRQGSLSARPDSHSVSTRQGSFPSRPDSSASKGPTSPSPLFNSTQRTCLTREPSTKYQWGHRRSYTAYGGYSGYSWASRSHLSMDSMDRLSQTRLSMTQFRHSTDILDRLPRSQNTRSRIDQVEPGLFLGNMDAATDILSLEGHRISHIVTVNHACVSVDWL